MNKLFQKMQCLSETKEIKSQEIYEKLFDKKCDKRYLESAVQKFYLLNKKAFSFLGIQLEMIGTGGDLSIKFTSSGFIGAIPVKMPYDGIAHKDFQIVPRFDKSEDVFSDLTHLLSRLNFSISPEFFNEEKLALPLQLRPPLYYEAVKFIELFEKAQKQKWVKFEVVKREFNFPKMNTDWATYSKRSYDAKKTLIYPTTDSILSINHKEWKQLVYVFNIAKKIILQQNIPASIRFKYRDRILALQKKNYLIEEIKTDEIVIHSSDPQKIKDVKYQANVLLKNGSYSCVGWRIDIAKLFERYVQYVVDSSIHGMGGKVISNSKISGRGQIPKWGLKYLEPDMIIRNNSKTYMADAKYKEHYYAFGKSSELLKETHRLDLHQILAYCSFIPGNNKVGILFYPSSVSGYKKIDYLERIGGINNTVFLYGIPFGSNVIDNAIQETKKMFIEF